MSAIWWICQEGTDNRHDAIPGVLLMQGGRGSRLARRFQHCHAEGSPVTTRVLGFGNYLAAPKTSSPSISGTLRSRIERCVHERGNGLLQGWPTTSAMAPASGRIGLSIATSRIGFATS